ncbi:LysR family transcriptional regulator [Cupriavidus metallidurans]|uniref:LysR family transcriptional regulator n=1 Tax=Cupriavidus metallidurans TaxID=119219 RepID=UPI001C552DC2|nr:LysR substrate-binding domain-containing protein [Cupriavidus metallidurans]
MKQGNPIDAKDFEYVLAVETFGGIGRAAESLGMTQPALTKAIQRVEAKVGMPLFERSTKGMNITSEGLVFLQRAKRIRMEYEDALKEMRALRSGTSGILRFGYSPSAPIAMVMGACRQLIRERPIAKLRLTTGIARELGDRLSNGDIDLALSPVPEEAMPGLKIRCVLTDRLVVVADPRNPLLQRPQLNLADLVDQQWLLPGAQTWLRQQIDASFLRQGLSPPSIRIETDFGSSALFDLIHGTDVITIAAERSRASWAPLTAISLPPEALDIQRRIAILHRDSAYVSPLAERMIEVLEQWDRSHLQ